MSGWLDPTWNPPAPVRRRSRDVDPAFVLTADDVVEFVQRALSVELTDEQRAWLSAAYGLPGPAGETNAAAVTTT